MNKVKGMGFSINNIKTLMTSSLYYANGMYKYVY